MSRFAQILTKAVWAVAFMTGVGLAWAQTGASLKAKEAHVEVRYRIRAAPRDRIPQFRAMVGYLESRGFKKDAGPEDEAENAEYTRMSGVIPADRARKALLERHIRSILLTPPGYQAPAEGSTPVHVELELADGLTLASQRLLADEVVGLLRQLGLQEAIGYDNRSHTRIVGTIPSDQVPLLLEDLRWHGTGWLVPQTPPGDLPQPLRDFWPVRVVTVLPLSVTAAKPVAAPPPVPANQEFLTKIAPDLRTLPNQGQPARLEVILVTPPIEEDTSWVRELRGAAADAAIEGRLGAIVTLRARPDQAPALARLPRVSGVRLAGMASIRPPDRVAKAEQAVAASGLNSYHAAGYRGRGVRIAIIGDDFAGYQDLVGKQLPANTRYLDLTATLNSAVVPEPRPDRPAPAGYGTRCALAAAVAAPEASLTLIRVDPQSPYQVYAIARAVAGDPVRLISLEQRLEEIHAANDSLQRRRDQLLQERNTVLQNFGQNPADVTRREAYFKHQEELDRENQELLRRQQRYLALVRGLGDLPGTQVVANSLVWEDCYPVDGSSTLSRYFDDRPFGPGLWFQSVDEAHGQVWAGTFRDVDGNGVMEFATSGQPLRRGRWTSELNFLGSRGPDALAPTLPKGRVRIAVQWREPHDPSLWQGGVDGYQRPLADLRMVILRQRDPSGERSSVDDMELVARSGGVPQRLDNQPSSAVYEQTVEWTVDAPGHYALRVEGIVPPTIRPPTVQTLPGALVQWELRPRFFIRMADPNAAAGSQPIFYDYATDQGEIGMPADSHRVISVGAARSSGKAEPASSGGPPFNEALQVKPDVLAFDAPSENAAGGAGVATSFAAGFAATTLSARVPPEQFLLWAHEQHGKLLRVPTR
jgi:hypothetical protein